jgi:hypothetical protein
LHRYISSSGLAVLMKKTLEQLLRSGDRKERSSAMDALSAEGTPAALAALMQVADGSRRRVFSRYDIHDQMYALNSMLDTKDPEAARHVREFFEPKVTERLLGYPRDLGWGTDDPNYCEEAKEITKTYPHARGELGEWLLGDHKPDLRLGLAYAKIIGRLAHMNAHD